MKMAKFRIGVQLQPQHTTYSSYRDAVKRVESLGVDTIFTWDHFFPLNGDPNGAHFESYSMLGAMAVITQHAEIGCLVTCNSYRNPHLLADMARTIDHISGGRFILGIGAGWCKLDYDEYEYEFGTPGTRLQSLADNLPVILRRWTKLNPAPIRQPRIPILVGGSGEKKTLKLAAQFADIWNMGGSPEQFRFKNSVLDNWCHELGRNPLEIERSVVAFIPEGLAQLDAFAEAGATHIILALSEPWNYEAVEQAIRWRESRNSGTKRDL